MPRRELYFRASPQGFRGKQWLRLRKVADLTPPTMYKAPNHTSALEIPQSTLKRREILNLHGKMQTLFMIK